MVQPDSRLLARLRARAQAEAAQLPPTLDQSAVTAAEQRLGFTLPALLTAVYREVGNGGFGPDYRLLPLDGYTATDTAVAVYLARRTREIRPGWPWPEGVLPILHWGCGMYACVDCRSHDGTVLLFEPNPGDPDLAWYIDTPSLVDWLTHYLDDTGWWVKLARGEDADDLPPWPDWRTRA